MIPAERLFPNWKTARIILKDFCDKTGDWIIENNRHSAAFLPDQIVIIPDYPMVKDELSGEMVPMACIFPPEEINHISTLLEDIIKTHLPDLSDLLCNKIDDGLKYAIRDRIKYHEHKIISLGGRSFKDEMRFKLGVLI